MSHSRFWSWFVVMASWMASRFLEVLDTGPSPKKRANRARCYLNGSTPTVSPGRRAVPSMLASILQARIEIGIGFGVGCVAGLDPLRWRQDSESNRRLRTAFCNYLRRKKGPSNDRSVNRSIIWHRTLVKLLFGTFSAL
jgi:hypothetical protein